MPTRLLTLSILLPALVCTSCSTTSPAVSRQAPPLTQAAADLKFARRKTLPAETRAGYYLGAAELAAGQLNEPAQEEKAQALYNQAAAELTDLLRQADDGRLWNRPMTFDANGKTYRLRYQPGNQQGLWSPGYFTDFHKAKKINRNHLRHHVVEPGVGGTLVGLHKTEGYSFYDRAPFEPKRGLAAPVTATLDFRGSDVGLTLNDPAERRTARINGQTHRLAADFTAPLAFHPARNELWAGLMRLMHVEKFLSSAGLFMLQPYDPDRIPVVFVHGLASTPMMWGNVMNEVEADPHLRGRYQFWVFSYPTGNPLTISALRCREDLAKIEKLYPTRQGLIMVGHSMGGLVSRLQVTDTGRAVWDRNLGNQADKLHARLPADNLIKRTLIFEANPKVKRQVYICVPHRGSEMALGTIGAIGMSLIRLPNFLISELTESLGDALQGLGGRSRIPNSITSLSPKNPTLLAIDKLPIRAPHHSIIGDRGRGDTPNSSDGVVPYWSSHLASAQSELIVPGPHGSHELPQTIAELVRILHQHIGKSDR